MKTKLLISLFGLIPAIAMAQAPIVIPRPSAVGTSGANGGVDKPTSTPLVVKAAQPQPKPVAELDTATVGIDVGSTEASSYASATKMVTMEPTKPMSISDDGLQKPPLPPNPVLASPPKAPLGAPPVQKKSGPTADGDPGIYNPMPWEN